MNKAAEKYIEMLKTQKQSDEFPFDVISKKVYLLLMYREAINKHPEGLEKSYKAVLDKHEMKDYASLLLDFVLLEIRDFYKNAWKKYGTNVMYPKTHEKVLLFRNNVVGHLKENIELSELLIEYEKIDAGEGFKKIHEEWLEFRDMIFEKLKEEKIKQKKGGN